MRTCLFSPSNTGVILRHKFDEELLETVVMVAKNGDVTIVSARQEEQAILGRWILRPTSLSARVSIMMVTTCMISCNTVV